MRRSFDPLKSAAGGEYKKLGKRSREFSKIQAENRLSLQPSCDACEPGEGRLEFEELWGSVIGPFSWGVEGFDERARFGDDVDVADVFRDPVEDKATRFIEIFS